jgi:hypothetical protein
LALAVGQKQTHQKRLWIFFKFILSFMVKTNLEIFEIEGEIQRFLAVEKILNVLIIRIQLHMSLQKGVSSSCVSI